MSNRYNGKRIFYFDVLRVIAILSIILCHTANIYKPYDYTSLKLAIPGFLNILGTVGVPLFFMISGALLLNRDFELKDFFKRRFSRILYPAIFWIAITVIISTYFLNGNDFMKIIFGVDRYTWFIWVMIGIYLFIPVINSFIKEFKLKGVEYFLAIWFITVVLKTIYKYPFNSLELSYFAGYIGYVVLGYYLANKDFKINNLVLSFLGIVLFIVFNIFHMYITYKGIGLSTEYVSLTVALTSIGAFLFIKGLTQYLENKSSKTYEKIKSGRMGGLIFIISACSYGMYFANSLIIRVIKLADINSVKLLPVLYIVIVASSLIVVYILSKIPGLKIVSGAS